MEMRLIILYKKIQKLYTFKWMIVCLQSISLNKKILKVKKSCNKNMKMVTCLNTQII